MTAIDRRGDAGDRFWTELDARFISLDVGAPRLRIADAVTEIGPLHGLVNVAGVDAMSDFPEYDDDEFARVVDINLRGPLYLIQELRSRMRSGTSIVNISSIEGLIVVKTRVKSSALYAASKAALTALTRQLAAELGPDGIRVNAVAPGLTATSMSAVMSEERRRWIVERSALGTIGRPEDIAAPTAFLLSDASRFVTGEVLTVDGGVSAAIWGPPELAA